MSDQETARGDGESRPSFFVPRYEAPRIIGHRGAAGLAPENTMASFQAAIDVGARMVELDAKLTADGEVICIHNDNLQKTTNASGPVVKNSWEAIRQLDAGSWFSGDFAGEPVPLLSDVLKLAKRHGIGVNVEIKPNPDQARETTRRSIEVIREVWDFEADGTMVLSSFWAESLHEALEIAPDIPRAFLAHRFERPVLDIATELRCAGFNANHRRVPKYLIQQAKDRGMTVAVYTVNEVDRARKLVSWGADSIFTDYPDRMLAANL